MRGGACAGYLFGDKLKQTSACQPHGFAYLIVDAWKDALQCTRTMTGHGDGTFQATISYCAVGVPQNRAIFISIAGVYNTGWRDPSATFACRFAYDTAHTLGCRTATSFVFQPPRHASTCYSLPLLCTPFACGLRDASPAPVPADVPPIPSMRRNIAFAFPALFYCRPLRTGS